MLLLVGLYSEVSQKFSRFSSTKFYSTPKIFSSDLPLSCASPNEVLVYDCSSRTINYPVTDQRIFEDSAVIHIFTSR